MSKKLYIHIGSHKTGTTSIQRALFQNSALLNKHNLSYFCKNPDGSKNVQHNLNKWIHLFPESFEDGARVYNCKKLSKDISTLPHDVIISAEHFSFIFDKEELKQLKNSLKQNFSEIEIIVYLRRQDKNVVSLYNENRKNATLKKRFFYGDKSTALPEHRDYFRLYLDYNEKLAMWADVFGKENITIRIFDKNTLIDGDAVSDFFHLIDIPNFKNTININTSESFEKIKIGFLMNELSIPNNVFRNVVNKNLTSNKKILPKREEAEELYKLYRKSNIALNKMFNISEKNEAIFDEDFSMYPEEGNELWTEENANEAISSMLKSLNDTYGNIDYNVLFQSALKLEKIDFRLSYNIMLMLDKMISEDKNVQKKLKSYQDFLKNKKMHIL